MRSSAAFVLVMLSCSLAGAQVKPLRGVLGEDIDRNADPCTDFFQYANGAWRAKNPIPASMDRWSRRWQSGEQNKEQLRAILEEISRKTDWPKGSVEQLIGDYYASCMDEKRVNELGLAPLRPLLAEIDSVKSRADLAKAIGRLHAIGISVPFVIGSMPDWHDPRQVIASIWARGLGLPDRDYYFKPEKRFVEAREKYRAHVAKMLELAGYDVRRAKAAAGKVFALETKLAGAQLDNVAMRDPKALDHRTSIAALQKMTPALDWKAYLDGQKVPAIDLNVDQPKFMQELQRRLVETPLADWKVYLRWHVLAEAAPWLSRSFVDERFAFTGKFLEGRLENKPRWKRCVESTDELLGEALGRKYVERHFSPRAKARAQEMVRNILAAMGDAIRNLAWMGSQTKQKALAKLATFNPKIGYPDVWKDYSGVDVARGSFWASQASARRFTVDDDHRQIGKPTDRGRWEITPPTSDAYYNPLLNEIVFPAGILQPPGFDVNATDAVNYGGMGVVIGHEISHGFDDQGSQFDAAGRLENWWTAADRERFRARAECLVEQYEGYFIEPGVHHQGKLVLGEAIGDLAGARVAYRALQKAKAQHPQPTVDGFTPDQQFFIAWGQWRGDEIRPETQRLMVQGDPHPIAKFRVVGPLANLATFQEAFACKPDAPMMRPPEERCEIW